MKVMFVVLKTFLEKKFQPLLVLIFLNLHKFLNLVGRPPFTNKSIIGRFFFLDHLKQNPKIKNEPKRYIHWQAFKPQKGEIGMSVFNITKLNSKMIIKIGNKYVGSYKNENVIGYLSSSIEEVNKICVSNQIPPFEGQYWPTPHHKHLNLNPTIAEAQSQLRCQLLAKKMSKFLETEQKTFSGEFF